MGMVVQANMLAMNANRHLGIVDTGVAKNTEKLSSGYKINRAADDAAGLAISEKMRRQIKGLTRASQNAMDGVSLCQIADGACGEVHDILNRMKVLSIQASNATNSDDERRYLQEEVSQLTTEIDRVNDTTIFNEMNVFCSNEPGYYNLNRTLGPGEKLYPNEAAPKEEASPFHISWEFVGQNGASTEKKDTVNSATPVGSETPYKDSDVAKFIEDAVASAASQLKASYPNLFSAAATKNIQIGLNMTNMDGAGGTLASAQLSLSSGSNTTMKYTLNVDTSDYPLSMSLTDAQKADLSSTIAHEMTHIMMYDTVTSAMVGEGTVGELPKWFTEGVAQASSGDHGWLSGRLNTSSSDADIKQYVSDLYTKPYGAGYAASMYLGTLASNSLDSVSSSNIRAGLDKILTSMANGKTLDEAIKQHTGKTLSEFEKDFKSGSDDTMKFMHSFLTERNNTGAGSIFDDLSATPAALFATPSGSSDYYALDRAHTAVENKMNDIALKPYTPGSNGSSEKDGGRDSTPPDLPEDEIAKLAEKLRNLGRSVPEGIIYSAPLDLQVGAEKGQVISLLKFDVSAFGLFFNGEYSPHTGWDGSQDDIMEFMETPDVSTIDSAQRTLAFIDRASDKISAIRSYYGATQNRLEHTIKNLDNVIENTTAAESAIRDTDMAKEMTEFSNNNIIRQAAQSVLAQANQSNQQILSLLG